MQQQHVPLKYPAVFIVVSGITLLIMLIGTSFGDPYVNGSSVLTQEPTTVAQEPTSTDVPTFTPEPTATPVPPTATTVPTEMPTEIPTEMPTEISTEVPTEAPTNTPEPSLEPTEAPDTSTDASSDYPAELIAQGETLYVTCSACHGMDGRGIEGLGKDLVESEFVHSLSDEELLDFVLTGRPIWDENNTTGIDMPPRGGNPALTNDDILAIIAYIRSLSTESAGEQSPTTSDSAAQDAPAAVAQFDETLALEGETVFTGACAACHGMDAQGIEGLGKNLVESEFVDSLSNEELVDFVITGRPIWDENNTTGIDMPPRGGNPALTNEQIMAVIHYIRSLKG